MASSPGSRKLVLMAQLVMYPALQEVSVLLMLYSQMSMSTNLLGQQVLSSPETALEVLLNLFLKCIEHYWVDLVFWFYFLMRNTILINFCFSEKQHYLNSSIWKDISEPFLSLISKVKA